MIAFLCPGCRQKLSVKDEFAGKAVACPHCRQRMQIPAAVPAAPEATTIDVPRPNGAENATLPPLGNASSLPPTRADGLDFLAPPLGPGELGRLGSYRVLKVLGAGGMGMVLLAEDTQLGRCVALKVMLPSLAASPLAKERFFREARAAAALKHPHIVTIHQVNEDRGVPFLAMEFLEGESLETRLKRPPRLLVPEILRLGREIAEGLAAAHAKGLIHRDIKPANIWLENREDEGTRKEDGKVLSPSGSSLPRAFPLGVKILDFGLARGAGDQIHLTQSGAIVGTPAYMAPEQAAGKPVDHRADLFSLGCVLYRMATGEKPFKGPDTLAVLSALALHEPSPPRSLNPELPAAFSDLVVRLLAKTPEVRPESAQEVVAALLALEKQPAAWLRPDRSARRSPRWAWIAGGGVVVLGVLGLWLLFKGGPSHQNSPRKPLEPEKNVSDSIEKTARDPVALRSTATLFGHTDELRWVVFAPDGKTLASSGMDKTIRLWDLTNNNKERAVLGGNAGTVICADFRKDGTMLASSAGDVVSLWRPKTGEKIADLKASRRGSISGVAFSPNGARLAGSSQGETVQVWNPDAPLEQPLILTAFKAPSFTSVVWGGDNQTVVAVSVDGRLFQWDVARPDRPRSFQAHNDRIETVAMSPDGQTLATAGYDRCARLWAKDGKCLGELTSPYGQVLCVAFSPDSKLVATVGSDGFVRLWDRAGKKLLAVGTGHMNKIYGVAFSPSGLSLASGSSDRTVRLWDVSALANRQSLTPPP